MKEWEDGEFEDMPTNFYNTIKEERDSGIKRPLTQKQHSTVNSIYNGLTMEECIECGEYTGHAGPGEDSIYTDDGYGPLCSECYNNNHKGK